jgi:D-serine deaminase-like pyridoxal phosphate-dependent protein
MISRPQNSFAENSMEDLLESTLAGLQTPSLLLDVQRMEHNILRARSQLASHGVPLRPHVKTSKCLPVIRRMMGGKWGPATVSTLKEAEVLASAGVRDILYAVGISPEKLDRVRQLRSAGVDLTVILDTSEQALAICAASRDTPIPALIEVDSDGHRGGLRPDDPMLVQIAQTLQRGGASFRGVMTHAGSSYEHPGAAALAKMAEQERLAAIAAAGAIRSAGVACQTVSVGSTPTALFAQSMSGLTEVRIGVFAFFDLFMHSLGVCGIDDIAISVLATVIGRQREKGWLITDSGWTAMSADRGSPRNAELSYGLVCDIGGRPYPDLILAGLNQEHGILRMRANSPKTLPDLQVGTRVRILPNHACATAASFDEYIALDEGSAAVERWPRFRGW